MKKNSMNNKKKWFIATLMMACFSTSWAQDNTHSGHSSSVDTTQMNHDDMSDMDMGSMDMSHDAMPEMNHSGHVMPSQAPSPGLRDPNAYADGYDFGQFAMRHEGGDIKAGLILVDRMEAVHADNNTSAAYDLQAWYGASFDRAVLKAEGNVDNGKLQEGRTEVLWSHAVSPFWDAQLGLRIDHGVNPDRGWLAFGVQGLAPYWFELNATAYIGDEGRSALRLGGEYDLLLTQKLILQPRIEADLYGKRDAERELGSGLSDLAAGIRLRYEIRREFAPYIGVEWAGKYGGTADYARAAGVDAKETRMVAGLRFWF